MHPCNTVEAHDAARDAQAPVPGQLQHRRPGMGCCLLSLCCLLGALPSTSALGQLSGGEKIRSKTLAEAVPASAGLFVELNRVVDGTSSSRGRMAYRLSELLIGSSETRDGVAADWRRLLLRSLGLGANAAVKNLLTHQLAVAAPSWTRLSEGIIVVRLGRERHLIDNVFVGDDSKPVHQRGGVRVYTTRTQLSAAANDEILILSKRRGRGSMFNHAIRLMRTNKRDSLADRPEFQREMAALAPDRDGTAYVDVAGEENAAVEFLSLKLRRLAIGMRFLESDHVAFDIRATRTKPIPLDPSATVSPRQLKELPQTTVGAWCTHVNVGEAFRDFVKKQVDENSPAYVRVLADALNLEDINEKLIAKLGPTVIVAWDQHLGQGPEVPQLTLLLESPDAAGCVKTAAEVVQVVVDWFDLRKHNGPASVLRLRLSEYLGTKVYEISFPMDPGSPDSDRLNGFTVTPAFAAVGSWFVISSSSDAIRNLIDARFGLAPKLGEMRGFGNLFDDRATTLAIAQPALAAQVVDGWLNDSGGVMNRWFAEVLGNGASPGGRTRYTPRLGIGTRPSDDPGSVLVARVYPNGRAKGYLQPGDFILGVNGSLLSLENTTGDLRQRLFRPPPDGQWKFRIRRDGGLLDVSVPGAPARRVSQSVTDPAGALRQLQGLFRQIEFGSIRLAEPSADSVVARLTLRFAAREKNQ